jgi:hypothetical protein
VPVQDVWKPSRELLAWHRDEVFRG